MFDPDTDFTMRMFMPFAHRKLIEGKEKNIRFVHYSSADAAKEILKNKEVWFRKTSCMNDYTEVRHGIICLEKAYNSEFGNKLRKIIDGACPGAINRVEELYGGWAPHFHEGTYVICLSEHDPSEDELGRLSMWRAYGKGTGFSLVFKNTPFFRVENTLNIFSSPVAYLSDEEFTSQFKELVENIENNIDDIKAIGTERVVTSLFLAFYFASLYTKHPGFFEEREWRVIYAPKMRKSDFMKKSIEAINGQPQIIYKLPLKNEVGTYGIEIPEILDRIIIGPCENAFAVKEALADLLSATGYSDPESRIEVSDIPIR